MRKFAKPQFIESNKCKHAISTVSAIVKNIQKHSKTIKTDHINEHFEDILIFRTFADNFKNMGSQTCSFSELISDKSR